MAQQSAVQELLPLISSLRDETESQRRIAARVVEVLRTSRLCRIAVPAELGGLELPPPEALSIYEQLAGAEASVAWIVWNSTLPCFFGRFFSPEVRSRSLWRSALPVCRLHAPQRARGGGRQFLSRQRTLVAGVRLRTRRLGGIALRDRGERPATHVGAECARGTHGVVQARRAGNTRHLVYGRAAWHRQSRCRRQECTRAAQPHTVSHRWQHARRTARTGSHRLQHGGGLWRTVAGPGAGDP